MSEEIREAMIQLRYARLKIEKIEGELKGSSVVPSGELRTEVDLVIVALKSAKSYLKEK